MTEKDGADPAPDTGLLSGTSSGDQGASTPSICAPKTSPAPERMRGAQPPTKRSEGGLDRAGAPPAPFPRRLHGGTALGQGVAAKTAAPHGALTPTARASSGRRIRAHA